ncbi:MAG: YiiX/YebB-like N1pC/P60 family cysteine hydrolase [Lepagella sp.]
MSPSRRRWLFIILAPFALFILFLTVRVAVVMIRRPEFIPPDTSRWHTGDLFFSVGDSWESVAVRALSGLRTYEVADSTPSHCGVVIRRGEEVLLLHASTIAGHVVLESPQQYLVNNGSFCLYACPPPVPVDSLRFTLAADSLLNANIPFDFNFNHNDPSALYCSELVVQIFELTSISPFSSLHRLDYIYPRDIFLLSPQPK